MPRTIDPQELVLHERRDRIEGVVGRRTRSLVVVLEEIEDPHNVAAVLRTCEAFGVQEVHAVTRRFAFRANPKITQGAEKWLDLFLYTDTAACLGALKRRGFVVCATDLGRGARSLLELDRKRPLALVFGNEKDGVSRAARELADLTAQIPMQGFAQSLNISVAVAVCVSHLVFRRIAETGAAGDLGDAERAELRERFSRLSVKQHHRLFDTARRDPEVARATVRTRKASLRRALARQRAKLAPDDP